ncbi:hypothetical protein [Pontibacter actiniarum]|uniref:Uncharacterized protein n=1 Tax=Pontibacter actiniarum TaxID=323450 RepID=A0A1X9YU33_9BACT|nr:hypothetical protein [Pontibacter actiniarum]ARS36430.1 hypothetical protein CA264_13845 [Pontibacter actiniarum]
MRKKIIPVLTIASLCFATSCGYDKTGTTTEVINSNADESVNPLHIRGYGNREPDLDSGRPAPKPNQYYAFSTTNLPPEVRQELDGQVAVEMVQTYYDPERQLSDLDVKYNRQTASRPAANVQESGTDVGDTTEVGAATVPVGSLPD